MRVIAYLLAGALLIAGCAEDKPKEPDPTSKPSPTATVPSMPPAAQENTKAGAIAFVKHYIDVFNYASNTGDVEELQRLSDPSCEGCTSYVTLYRETYGAGGYYKGGNWRLKQALAEKQDGALVIFVHITAPAPKYRTAADKSERSGSPEDSDLTFVPGYRSGGWVLQEFGRQGGVGE